jgi:predicted transcriptional regulator
MATKKDKMISVDEETYKQIKKIAQREERTIRSVIERAIRIYDADTTPTNK